MPDDFGKIEILDLLAVNVCLKSDCQMGNPFNDTPLGTVIFIEKG
jgi:hypothetical protein